MKFSWLSFRDSASRFPCGMGREDMLASLHFHSFLRNLARLRAPNAASPVFLHFQTLTLLLFSSHVINGAIHSCVFVRIGAMLRVNWLLGPRFAGLKIVLIFSHILHLLAKIRNFRSYVRDILFEVAFFPLFGAAGKKVCIFGSERKGRTEFQKWRWYVRLIGMANPKTPLSLFLFKLINFVLSP